MTEENGVLNVNTAFPSTPFFFAHSTYFLVDFVTLEMERILQERISQLYIDEHNFLMQPKKVP